MKDYTLSGRISALLLTILFLFQSGEIKANHIIGGDMYYDCLGFKDGDPRTNIRVFRVYLELYRDCQARNAAYFDPLAHMTIFKGNSEPYTIHRITDARYTGPDDIDPPAYPCLTIPPNVCVHKALYTYDVELEISSESYHLVWQRCCRNESISNIYTPGDIGSTFTVEITPLAQQRCNNSPRFSNFPPTVICVDEPLVFDHGATDAEGDNIVYELCAPLVGGGRNFGGNGCDTPNPNPDCPPPFGTVTFRAPQFTSAQPLGFNSNMSLDRTTGLLRASPQIQGQFVVGICMKEYRNGTLLSTIRRDFQFNVSTCIPNFSADVKADELGPNDEIIIKSCGDLDVRFSNTSQGNIDSILWMLDFGDTTVSSKEWNPTITFPNGGIFDGQLIVNPNTQCSDTADLIVKVVEKIEAGFEAEYDTCDAGPVNFTDQSEILGSEIIDWFWDFSDRKRDTVPDPVVNYDYPGDYLVKLFIEDRLGCRDTFQDVVSWLPAPDVIIVEPSVEEGCVPLEVAFENLSFPVNEDYEIKWKFSDGGTVEGLDAFYTFRDTGIYSLKVEITSPLGCYAEREFQDVIQVFPRPVAGFTLSEQSLDQQDASVTITDTSLHALGREWLLEDFGVYFERSLNYTFSDTGRHVVRLIAVDRFGCTDTLIKYVDVAPLNTLHFPNAFSPNGDGNNDGFGPVGFLENIREYEMTILNRYGEVIFVSQDPGDMWDGTIKGRSAPPAVYIMECRYTEARGGQQTVKGFVTLVK